MRLRLRIERNELPAVNILWAIGDTELRQTVAQFLERVNDRFPLEGESWGLEDYAVTIGGFEALHYNETGACFQNEDEVVIKPLQYVDVRARTITGRNQISEDGRHLVDGVAWGRPLLKRARRPVIKIPPRKRQRLDADTKATTTYGELLLEQQHYPSNDDDDIENDSEADSDFEPDDDEDQEIENEQTTLALLGTARRKRLVDDEANANDEDSEESEDEYWSSSSCDDDSRSSDDEDVSDDDSDASSSDSDDNSSDASVVSEESWDGIEQSELTTSASTSSSSVSIQVESAKQSDTHPEKLTSHGIPFDGSSRTRARNSRRREQRKLKHLKEGGTLHADATIADMIEWEQMRGLIDNSAVKAESQRQAMERERQRLLDQIASGGVDIDGPQHKGVAKVETGDEDSAYDSPVVAPATPTYPPAKRRKIADLNTNKVASDTSVGFEEQSPANTSDMYTATAEGTTAGDTTATAEPAVPQRRLRLDAAGTDRLIFGSLGLRAPKTQAERDTLQKKLTAKATRTAVSAPSEQVTYDAQADEDPNSWRDKLDVSAVECCDPDITLSAPPFPFKQRWDPQYHYRKNKRQKKRHQALSNTVNGDYVETYDKYNVNGGSDALDYDDPVESGLDEEYWEDGALLGDEDEVSIESFPDLPSDITTLASLAETDARQGDIIVFEELACSAATGWQPKTLSRTVRLESNDGDGWHVKFAMRDLRPREYNEDGQRVYSKFEMEGVSDDEDDGEKTLLWDAMTNPRLLRRHE